MGRVRCDIGFLVLARSGHSRGVGHAACCDLPAGNVPRAAVYLGLVDEHGGPPPASPNPDAPGLVPAYRLSNARQPPLADSRSGCCMRNPTRLMQGFLSGLEAVPGARQAECVASGQPARLAG